MKPYSALIMDHGKLMHNETTKFILKNKWIEQTISIDKCAQFKEGKYFSLSPLNKLDTIRFYRTVDRQIEKSNKGEFEVKLRWLSDCEYELELMKNREIGIREWG